MTIEPVSLVLPDRTQLPESDGTFVSQSLAAVPPVVPTGKGEFSRTSPEYSVDRFHPTTFTAIEAKSPQITP